MKFRSEYKVRPSAFRLDPELPVTLLGSCFSENIGAKMRRALWDARINPCGVLFNPASIRRILSLAASPDLSTEIACSIAYRDGCFVSLLFDSGFASLSFAGCLEKCMAGIEALREALHKSQALIVTLGTSWVYAVAGYGESGSQVGFGTQGGLGSIDKTAIVANCHKFPAAKFRRFSLTVDEVAGELLEIKRCTDEISGWDYPLVVTVSPVRHLRDDFHENTLSKATLQLGVAKACESIGCRYFPAYEILLDDLRDYRFYAADLAHPSEEAVQYIWEKFCQTYLSDRSQKLISEGESLVRRASHRPLVEDSSSSVAFREALRRDMESFAESHPAMLKECVLKIE